VVGITNTPDIDSALRRIRDRLATIRRRTDDRILVEASDKLLVHTRLQLLFNLKFVDEIERTLYGIIINHAMAAERLGPGGFDMCIERLLEKLDHRSGSGTNGDLSKKIEGILGAGSSPATRADIDRVVATYTRIAPARTGAMLRQALDLAGFAGRILIEKSPSSVPSVELVRGYTFEHAAAFPISVRLERPRVVCIDGYIESVAEVHHLLEAASESKEPALLFVRGLDDEVRHTLKVNFDRGSLKVVPIIVRFDLEGMNALNDISIATGADLVTSNKGDLISTIKFHEAPRVIDAIVHGTKVVVRCDSTRAAVEAQVAFLRKRLQTEQVDDIVRLINLRIRSLSPNHVVIRLPNDSDYVLSSQAIDYTLRAIRSLVDHGTVTLAGERKLAATVIAAEVHSTRCEQTLSGLGALVS
jgi:chaperonin GroEL (HSP60 family)